MLVLTGGGVIGIDIIMKERHWRLRDLGIAHCLTFVQTASITREVPAALTAIRTAARRDQPYAPFSVSSLLRYSSRSSPRTSLPRALT